ADEAVPVIERIRFLGIFSSNMDEFFQVRVADVRRRIFFSKDDEKREKNEQLMAALQEKVLLLQQQFDQILERVLAALADEDILLLQADQLNDDEQHRLQQFFIEKIRRFVVPILISEKTQLANILREDENYLCVEILGPQGVEYALIEVPCDSVDRFIRLPGPKRTEQHKLLFLDDILQLNLAELFRGMLPFQRLRSFSFKMTRDSEYRPSDDIEQSLLERMEEGLKQRIKADPVRLVYDKQMPHEMLEFLSDKLQLNPFDSLVAGGRYRNTRDFAKFPNYGRVSLEHRSQPALIHPKFERFDNVFDAIQASDILLYYPYHRFSQFTEFVRQAAYDPKVTRIALCIYRVAPNSRVIRSLANAVQNGKQVTVMVELQARFDEEANIEWAKELTESGVRVSFGIQGLKVHSKLVMVYRQEDMTERKYAVIGTGNFHEGTAQVYTDFSLFTCKPELCNDVQSVFQYLDQPYKTPAFHHLLVAPITMRQRLTDLIEAEIEQAQNGEHAEVFIKVNNLEDKSLIVQLYRASRAGVKIRCLVRGMCSLRAGVDGLSENIEVRSIVDRYLEHARVYVFAHGGNPQIYLASADLMKRNLDHRVEVACPLIDRTVREDVLQVMELQWRDRAKSRIVDAEQKNVYCCANERTPGNRLMRSQLAIYRYFKHRTY
ncbi:MAG: polyphosphate kinase 1, partial [Pseudomonadota bacterium]